MIRIQNIIENKFYVYITQQNENYFYFNYRDENTLWVTDFSFNKSFTKGTITRKEENILIYEKFWVNIRNFGNEVYAQGWEATKMDKEHLIKYLFQFKLK